MGNTMPKRLDAKTVGHLKRSTHLDQHQLRRLHKQFRDLSGGTYTITREQFYEGLKKEGVYTNDDSELGKLHGKDWQFIESFFDALDRDNLGKISFKEFCTGIAVFVTGNLQDSLVVIFEMYNIAGDNKITEEELYQALVSLSSVLQLDHFTPGANDKDWLHDGPAVRAWVKHIVAECDVSNTGGLSFNEFQAAVHKHPLLKVWREGSACV